MKFTVLRICISEPLENYSIPMFLRGRFMRMLEIHKIHANFIKICADFIETPTKQIKIHANFIKMPPQFIKPIPHSHKI